jgi:hypothetical protein
MLWLERRDGVSYKGGLRSYLYLIPVHIGLCIPLSARTMAPFHVSLCALCAFNPMKGLDSNSTQGHCWMYKASKTRGSLEPIIQLSGRSTMDL